MANSKDVKKVKRQMTFVLEYEHEDGCGFDEPLRILDSVVSALRSWNQNRCASAYNSVSISGFWLEPDEVPFEKQNELLDDLTKDK